MTKRILVTGSRDWADIYVVEDALYQAMRETSAQEDIVVVHGQCARGADDLADRWAERQRALGITVERHPADWNRYGKSAGYRRNAEMVALGADICLAFQRNGSKGTQHTIDLCRKAGIPVKVFTDNG